MTAVPRLAEDLGHRLPFYNFLKKKKCLISRRKVLNATKFLTYKNLKEIKKLQINKKCYWRREQNFRKALKCIISFYQHINESDVAHVFF